MRSVVAAAALALVAGLPQPQATSLPGIARQIQIIYVEPAGEVFAPAEQAGARSQIEAAMQWWEELSPITLTLTITGTSFMTTTADFVYDEPGLFVNTVPRPAGWRTLMLFVVDNQTSLRGFYGGKPGTSWPGGDIALMTLASPLAAVTAHELGHLLFYLTDLYHAPCAIDIMCRDIEAYAAHTIGCVSLGRMGYPCRRVFVPYVTVPPSTESDLARQ